MSYDIGLSADLGGPEPIHFGDWNYTSNCARMWRLAGADLADFHGKTAEECIPRLRRAIEDMMIHPVKFRELEPSNGWGSLETLIPALRRLLELFESAPKAEVWVSR